MKAIAPGGVAKVAETVGISAVKYADAARTALATMSSAPGQGDLAPEQHRDLSAVRVRAGIEASSGRGKIDPEVLQNAPLLLEHPGERAHEWRQIGYPESLVLAAADFKPNVLRNYLFELANRYNSFFRDCPVLKAPSDDIRLSRLLLCELTARTIRQGLSLLGIATIERM
ncbi:MAG: DALR anticodon-binding domain-containing protein [Planctomycetota bacterium]